MTIHLATGAPARSGGGRAEAPLASRRPSTFAKVLAVALVVPGGLLILAGLGLVWLGLAPLLPWLSRLTAAQAPDPRQRPAAGEHSPSQTAPKVPGGVITEPAGQERREPRPHVPETGGPFLVVQREHEA